MHPNPVRIFFVCVGLFACAVVVALLGGYVYLHAKAKEPFSRPGAITQKFTVEKGDGARQIAAHLAQSGFVANPLYFVFAVWEGGFGGSLQAGTYLLSGGESPKEIAAAIAEGKVFRDTVMVTVPEGLTVSDIEALCEKAGLFSGAEKKLSNFHVSDFSWRYSFLRDAPPGSTLEGYLFPDTYEFERTVSPFSAAVRMLDNFGLKLDAMTRRTDTLDIVVMASLIQKEIVTTKDMKLVSGILSKRISIGMPLQVDASIIYVTGRSSVSTADLAFDSPYNTYLRKGLPPGPISNPGSDALEAALNPTASDYLYYLSKPTGETVFSKTLSEHNLAKQTFLR